MTLRLSLLCSVAGGVIFGLAHGALADYSGNCTFSGSTIVTIQGDQYSNDCYGGSSQDSFYMYGAADNTHGRGNSDDHRGADGDDTLEDTQGTDSDDFCDGSGSDEINMQDGDNYDAWYRIADGDNDDPVIKDSGDIVTAGWSSCPV